MSTHFSKALSNPIIQAHATEVWVHHPSRSYKRNVLWDWNDQSLPSERSLRMNLSKQQQVQSDSQLSYIDLGVPSCSTMSGAPHMAAYALLQIFPNGSLTYILYPLPNRRVVVVLYGVVIVVAVLFYMLISILYYVLRYCVEKCYSNKI